MYLCRLVQPFSIIPRHFAGKSNVSEMRNERGAKERVQLPANLFLNIFLMSGLVPLFVTRLFLSSKVIFLPRRSY